MRPRAIQDLVQLPDPEFFESVSEGFQMVVRNACRLNADAQSLADSDRQVSARVLLNVAREESAKALILMDAVGCARKPESRLSNHLARFNQHLAKGLYVEAYEMGPTMLGQIQHFLDFSRRQYFLDGPNDVDWVFRNSVLDQRERPMYVDYEATDDGHHWSDPGECHVPLISGFAAIRVATALADVGACTAPALEVIANIWRDKQLGLQDQVQAEFNRQTLNDLAKNGHFLAAAANEDRLRTLVYDWKLPLIDLQLDEIPVRIDDLREQQRNWDPGGYWDSGGCY